MNYKHFFQEFILIRYKKNIVVFLLVSLGLCSGSYGIGNDSDVYSYLNRWSLKISPVSQKTFEEIKGIDPLILPPLVKRQNVLNVSVPEFRQVMDFFISHKLGSLEFWAHPFFRENEKIFYLSKDVLRIVNAEYLISTVFFPRGYTYIEFYEKGYRVPQGSFFDYEIVLYGGGKIVVVYPFPLLVKRNDALYGFLTGKYSLHRVNFTEIVSIDEKVYHLRNFVGRNDPQGKLVPVTGPFRSPIHEMIFSKKKNRVKVHLGPAWWNFPHPRLEKYSSPLYSQSPEESGLPGQFIEETKKVLENLQPPNPENKWSRRPYN